MKFFTGFFLPAFWTPLGGSFRKVFGTTFDNSKQKDVSRTNYITYYLKTFPITFQKRCVHGRLIKIMDIFPECANFLTMCSSINCANTFKKHF